MKCVLWNCKNTYFELWPFLPGCELSSTPVPCCKSTPGFSSCWPPPHHSLPLIHLLDPTSLPTQMTQFHKRKTTLAHWNSSWSYTVSLLKHLPVCSLEYLPITHLNVLGACLPVALQFQLNISSISHLNVLLPIHLSSSSPNIFPIKSLTLNVSMPVNLSA